MNIQTQRLSLEGAAGLIEALRDESEDPRVRSFFRREPEPVGA